MRDSLSELLLSFKESECKRLCDYRGLTALIDEVRLIQSYILLLLFNKKFDYGRREEKTGERERPSIG
jgi:hypothetical protein